MQPRVGFLQEQVSGHTGDLATCAENQDIGHAILLGVHGSCGKAARTAREDFAARMPDQFDRVPRVRHRAAAILETASPRPYQCRRRPRPDKPVSPGGA